MRTDGSFHGSFTLAPLPTAWFLMRRRRNGSARIFSHAEGALRSEKSVEIREICGSKTKRTMRQRTGRMFFILPQIAQIDTDAMRDDGLPQIAPLARQIDTDLSQAERGL